MAFKRYQIAPLLITSLLLNTPIANAVNECLDKTCVDVFTSDNQLIITAQKGKKGASGKPATKKIAASPKPKLKPFIIPKLIAKPVVSKKPVIAKKVVIKKAVAKAKVASGSLSDKLIKMLPVGDINFQPEQAALVHVPVYFYTQTPSRFTAVIPILDVLVYVNLTPTFTWSFGDGGLQVSTNQGGRFPIGQIRHTYKKSDDYRVNLLITWRGFWSLNGVTTPISGNAITQSISRGLSVVASPTKFIE